jgi:hypothetical protein
MNIQNIIGNNLLLFTVNIWIKKPPVANIQNNFLGIISHFSISDSMVYELREYGNTKVKIGF